MKLLRIILISCIIIALSICYATSSHAAYISHVRNATDAPLVTCGCEYIGDYWITGYVPGDLYCCGKTDGIGASGKLIIPGEHVASSREFAFGTSLHIAGLGEYTVEDRGVGAGVLDVACETYAECYAITGRYLVYIVG